MIKLIHKLISIILIYTLCFIIVLPFINFSSAHAQETTPNSSISEKITVSTEDDVPEQDLEINPSGSLLLLQNSINETSILLKNNKKIKLAYYDETELHKYLLVWRALQDDPDAMDYYKKNNQPPQDILDDLQIDHLQPYDIRIIKFLNYLVAPVELGGAGHEFIEAKRIRSGYKNERQQLSKESEFSEADGPNISAHFDGQAVDISAVDYLKCTLLKRRRAAPTKRVRQTPKPIQVAWQSDQGLAGASPFGNNFNELSQNMVLADFDDIFTPEGRLKPDAWKVIIFELGKYRLADELEIDEIYIEDSTPDTFYRDFGYALLAKDLEANLLRPPCGDYSNVLSGDAADMYRRLALNELEDNLELPRGSIGLNPVKTASDINDLYSILKNIGKRQTEKNLELPACHFDQTPIDWNLVKQKIVEKRHIYQSVDQALNLPTTVDGAAGSSTQRLDDGDEKVFYVIGAATFLTALNYQQEDEINVLHAVEAGEANIKISFKNKEINLEISTDDLEKIFQKSDSSDQAAEDAYVVQRVNELTSQCQAGQMPGIDPGFCQNIRLKGQWEAYAREEYRQKQEREGERSRKTILEKFGQTLWEKYTNKNIKKIRGPLREAIMETLGKNTTQNVVNASDLYQLITQKKFDNMLNLAGIKVMENTMDLPPRSLSYFFIRDKNEVWVNRDGEKVINTDKFKQDVGEARINELIAQQNAKDFAQVRTQLGDQGIDKKLLLDPGTTSQFQGALTGAYYQIVGNTYLTKIVVSSVMSMFDFNPRIGTYFLNTDDITNLLLGNWNAVGDVLKRIGSKWAEEELETPEGFIFNLVSDPNPQNALLVAGGLQIARAFGLAYLDLRDVGSTGDFVLRLGQEKVEESLALKRGSFQNNLQYIQEQNGVEKLARAFGWLPDNRADFTAAYSMEKATQWRQGHNGEAASNEQIADWVAEATEIYNEIKNKQGERWQYVDRALILSPGTTEKFTKGQMNVTDFSRAVGNNLVASDFFKDIDVDQALGLGSDYDFGITGADIYNAIAVTHNWNDFVNKVLYNGAGYKIDEILNIDKGTFQEWYTETDPVEQEKILIIAGAKKLAEIMGVDYDDYEGYVKIYINGGIDEAYRQAVVDQIQNATHIPSAPEGQTPDATAFIDGRVKEGLTYWGMANLIYTEDESGTVVYRYLKPDGVTPVVTYDELRTTIYGDRDYDSNMSSPEHAFVSQIYTDYAVDRVFELQQQCAQAHPNDNFCASQNFGDQASQDWERNRPVLEERARAEYRRQQLRNVSYNIIDWQLQKLDQSIPSGFARAMLEGTGEQRVQLLLQYASTMALRQALGIPQNIASVISSVVISPDGKITPADFDRLKDAGVFTWLDGKWEDIFGFRAQEGTAEAVYKFAANDFRVDALGGLKDIYQDWATNKVYGWFDKKWGLKDGTAKLIYDSYTNYYKAYKAYQSAKAAGDAVSITQAAQNLKAVQASALAAVITFAFSQQLAQTDQKLGLVPGTSAMLVSYLLAPSPITLALAIVLNLFGVYRVEMYCSVVAYPRHGSAYLSTTDPAERAAIQSSVSDGAPGIFNALDSATYKAGLKEAAQWKVRKLLTNTLDVSSKMGKNMRPTQIMTLRKEDVDAFKDKLNQLYGIASNRWRSGMWANKSMYQYIHVGY